MSNYWGRHVLLDPSDMERMFSEEDGLSELPSLWEEMSDDATFQLENVKEFLDLVPPREADFIELYFFRRMRQTAIAELFNISQPSVVYRLQRGARRLKYLIEMPQINRDEMKADLRTVIEDDIDIDIMMGMFESTCQSEVARDLSEKLGRRITQGFVRHRFLRSVERLEAHPGMDTYVEVFRHVSENSTILRNTCRAQWDEEVIFSLH